MLVLDEGKAMSYLVSRLEALKFKWAYRLVNSRFSGVPHRRHRVLFVASRHHDPREVLSRMRVASRMNDATPRCLLSLGAFFWLVE